MSVRVFVPGRIEVLGKHTDYAGGSSLLVATDRGFTFEAEPLAGERIVFVAEDTGEEAAYAIERCGGGVRAVPASAGGGGWTRYVDGVLARTFAEFGEAACGARVSFRSDLPAAAGLSTSSALVCGVFLALDAVCRFSALPSFRRAVPDRDALAGFLAAAEMGGPVGTRGGSEDHVAILCARPGQVVRYGLAPIRFRGAAPVPDGWTFAVGASGVTADKGGAVQAHYNRLSDLAAEAARAWAAANESGDEDATQPQDSAQAAGTSANSGGGLRGRELDLGAALELAGSADALLADIREGAARLADDAAPLVRRARHFVEECALVDAAFEALERGDIGAFADAANGSATVGAALLENQVPETLRLTALAHALGAPAASPFGGGFGGAVWALVREADAERFVGEWRARYRAAFPQRARAEFFVTGAGGPAGDA